jgi:peptidyl-tRNA hydrolase
LKRHPKLDYTAAQRCPKCQTVGRQDNIEQQGRKCGQDGGGEKIICEHSLRRGGVLEHEKNGTGAQSLCFHYIILTAACVYGDSPKRFTRSSSFFGTLTSASSSLFSPMKTPLDADIQALLDERKRTMADFTADYRPLNLYAIYRADLDMPPEKLAAQCGHAFQLALELARAGDSSIEARYKGTGNGTKICMYAKNLGQLLRAYREAQAAGLPCSLVIDRGHVMPPWFDGEPIITALGIGPVFKDVAEPITRRLTMTRRSP